MTLPLNGGEIVSAVVAPKLKSQCMGGRVLVANDWVRPFPTTLNGIVQGIDLDGSGKTMQSVHDTPPIPELYTYGSNDHNLVSLPNGDVIYQEAGFSKAPTSKEWGPYAFRNGFGPNARTVQLTWRSTDCGEHFTYVGKADPVVFSQGGVCGNPQGGGALDAAGHVIYDMGGTDGPRVDVNHKTGQLILTYGCVGEYELGKQPAGCQASFPLAPKSGKQFTLSGCDLNMTYVVASNDFGTTWQRAGVIESGGGAFWRGATLPTKNGLAIVYGTGVFLGTKATSGFDFKSAPVTLPGVWGYDQTFPSSAINNQNIANATMIGLNMASPAVVARVPGSSDLLLAGVGRTLDVPGNPGGTVSRTQGYDLYYVNIDTRQVWQIPPVVPAGKSAGDVIIDLTAIDLGSGPVLLYWYDISTSKKTAAIRGRVLYGQNFVSPDFTLSRANGADQSFALTTATKVTPAYFYGDYKMAEGFAGPPPAKPLMPRSYTYLPVWVEPNGVTHVARVDVIDPTLLTPAIVKAEQMVKITPLPVKQIVPHFSIPAAQRKLLREHDLARH